MAEEPEMERDFVRYGDQVSLLASGIGHLAVSSVFPPLVEVCNAEDGQPPTHFERCVFSLQRITVCVCLCPPRPWIQSWVSAEGWVHVNRTVTLRPPP